MDLRVNNVRVLINVLDINKMSDLSNDFDNGGSWMFHSKSDILRGTKW
jgi:hypothetical protein